MGLTKEKAEKILATNCLEDERGKEKLMNLLGKTKWFKNKELNMSNMQKVYDLVSEKYSLQFGTMIRSKNSYSVVVLRQVMDENKKFCRSTWIETVYAYDLEEMMVKALLLMYFSAVEGLQFKDGYTVTEHGTNK